MANRCNVQNASVVMLVAKAKMSRGREKRVGKKGRGGWRVFFEMGQVKMHLGQRVQNKERERNEKIDTR